MDKAIKQYYQQDINEKIKLTGGYTFVTWLLVLSNNQKVVFRSQQDFQTASGREIIIVDILQREKFFYETVNKKIGRICPEVYVVDGTREYHENSFCIMEYVDGIPLDSCFADFDKKKQNDILFKIGETAAKINEWAARNLLLCGRLVQLPSRCSIGLFFRPRVSLASVAFLLSFVLSLKTPEFVPFPK